MKPVIAPGHELVGIVTDDYKVPMFKEQLASKGLEFYDVTTFSHVHNTSLIRIIAPVEDRKDIEATCRLIELYLKHARN